MYRMQGIKYNTYITMHIIHCSVHISYNTMLSIVPVSLKRTGHGRLFLSVDDNI
jgi:hypothetical protein